MTKEEARQLMGSLNLSLQRLLKEIESIKSRFCDKGDHYFFKIWSPLDSNRKRFVVTGYFCVLCSARRPLEAGANRCPVCNGLLETFENIGLEDINNCSFCNFIS